MFKLELVKTYYLGFDVLVLQKCCGCNTFKNCLNKQISLKVQIKYLIVIFKIVSDQDTKNWLVPWSDNKKLPSGADAISWNSLLKKKKKYFQMTYIKIAIFYFFFKSTLFK